MTGYNSMYSSKNIEPMELSETELIQWAATLSPAEIEQAVVHMWNQLQQVPSYVETMIEANYGTIEGIAAQH